jgi:hypothetical protein
MYNVDFCPGAGPFDFRNQCIRTSWASLLPGAFVFALLFVSVPVPAPLSRAFGFLKAPFEPLITLQEAEDLVVEHKRGPDDVQVPSKPTPPLWRTLVFTGIGLAQTLFWLTYGSFRAINRHPTANVYTIALPFLVAAAWLYTVVRSVFRPSLTPPYDHFALYIFLFLGAVLQLGGVVYDHSVLGDAWPTPPVLVALSVNLGSVIVVLGVLLAMPLAIPGPGVNVEEIVGF